MEKVKPVDSTSNHEGILLKKVHENQGNIRTHKKKVE